MNKAILYLLVLILIITVLILGMVIYNYNQLEHIFHIAEQVQQYRQSSWSV